jgi:hypothetical protein
MTSHRLQVWIKEIEQPVESHFVLLGGWPDFSAHKRALSGAIYLSNEFPGDSVYRAILIQDSENKERLMIVLKSLLSLPFPDSEPSQHKLLRLIHYMRA